MPRPPSSRPHDAEAGRKPPSHAWRSLRTYGAGRTMWATEYALQEPPTEGRAIDLAAVERMFDATRGAHISPGEFEHIWRGQSGPPADRFPETLVALAFTDHAFTTGRRPIDETPARAPAGGTR